MNPKWLFIEQTGTLRHRSVPSSHYFTVPGHRPMFPGGPAVPMLGWALDERVGKVVLQSWASWSKDPGKAGSCQGWALEAGAGRWEGEGVPIAAAACAPLTSTLQRS